MTIYYLYIEQQALQHEWITSGLVPSLFPAAGGERGSRLHRKSVQSTEDSADLSDTKFPPIKPF